MNKFILATILSVLSLDLAYASSPFSNLDTHKDSLGFTTFYNSGSPGRRLKVAVLDKGFKGYKEQIGISLPPNTRYVPGPVDSSESADVEHGLRMAQILTGMMTDDLRETQWMPELTLYNVFGYTNFKAAIDDVIARKVDLVLYSEVWEYGGNSDGKGFINREVTRATKAGVIWVNAAGNFGRTTYSSEVRTLTDGWVKLPNQNNALQIRCDGNSSGKCPVKIVLSWNDFKDDVNLGTDKDLDIALTDDFLNIIQSSSLKQSTDPKENRPGYSKYPREIIAAEIKTGSYLLRVKNRSANFSKKDRLRITVDGDGIIMPSYSPGESLLNPADNASVISVGASDSDRSSISLSLNKPDLLAPSSIRLNSGEEYRGSSNSAAIVAAGLALLKSEDTTLTRQELLQRVRRGGSNSGWDQKGLSLGLLGFGFTGPGCFQDVNVNPTPSFIREVLSRGGVPVQTTHAVRIMVPFDPITLSANLRRMMSNDMIVALPQGGYGVFSRQGMIPAGAVEIFQRPLEAGLCQTRSSGGKNFYLPFL